jgi:IS5 family transposase
LYLNLSGGQSERTVHRKGGARGYDGGKKIKGRKRHIVVDSQGSVLGVWVSPAEVSDARGARVVLESGVASVSVGADSDRGWGV